MSRRGRAWLTALALLPSLALLAWAAPHALRQGARPELSCWVLPNLQVLAVPGNEACPVAAAETIARVRLGDRVLPLRAPGKLHALVASAGPWLQVELRQGSRSRWADVPVRTPTRGTRLARLAAAVVAIALLLGIPLSLLWRTPAPAAAPLALFYACASLVLLAICAGQDSALLTSAALAGLLLAPGAAVHLALVFPRERPLLREVPGLIAAPYVACALLAPVGWTALARDALLWPAFVALLALLTTLTWLALVLSCWSALRASRSALERARARLVLHGSLLVPVLPALLLAHASLGSTTRASLATAQLATAYVWSAALGMPLPIALAIGRHNLFDLESDVRHAIARSLYLALAAGVVVMLLRAGAAIDPAPELLLAGACVAAIELLRSRTLGALEALIVPQLQHLRRVRQELENALAIQKQREQIASLVSSALQRGIPSRCACVLLREPGAWQGAPGFGVAAALHAVDVRRIERLLGPQPVLHLAASTSLDREGCDWMERGIEAVVAIESGGTRYGLLLLDAPPRRPPLNGLELEFAQALAARAATALHNARLTAERVASERHAAVGRLALGLAHDVGKDLGWMRLLVRRLPGRVGDPARLARDAAAIGELTDGLATAIERFVQDATRAPGEDAPRLRLDALVAEALRRVERIHGCGRVRLQIPPALEGIRLDATLGRAICNLLDNALHASHDGSPVALCASHDARWIQIEIEDRGCGIPEPALARVLEPGFTTRAGDGGSGVGLPVALQIAEALGGALELRSGPRGTRARIRTPVPR